MWISILNTISSIVNSAGEPGPEPGAKEIVTQNTKENIISEDNKELIIE